ncbi:MAG: flagellar biosynthetic protein FliR, partial [Oscillospiraceae bacterium]|nr:flagellar biosynthetic protein FliR [Oscillospiraceae bacterium]
MDFWEVLFDNFEAKLLIFARILGIFSFNPMLSRSNIPARVRIGATMLITYVVALTLDTGGIDTGNTMGEYVMCFVRELFIGLVLGFICDMFVYMIYLAGDVMDAQAGLGMAKVFDPSTSIQMSMYGSYAGFMLYLYFFASNAHLMLIRIFVNSFEVIPLCSGYVNWDIGWLITEMFARIFALMLQLAMPVVAAELIVEFCVGILMKAVPQIQIMVVNIQLKV